MRRALLTLVLGVLALVAAQSSSSTPSASTSPSETPSESTSPSTSVTPSSTTSRTPSRSMTRTASLSRTASLTPSVSRTPSITPSPSTTPSYSTTPSTTPSLSVTPTVSTTPSITSSTTPSTSTSPSTTPSVTTTRSPSQTRYPTLTPSSSTLPRDPILLTLGVELGGITSAEVIEPARIGVQFIGLLRQAIACGGGIGASGADITVTQVDTIDIATGGTIRSIPISEGHPGNSILALPALPFVPGTYPILSDVCTLPILASWTGITTQVTTGGGVRRVEGVVEGERALQALTEALIVRISIKVPIPPRVWADYESSIAAGTPPSIAWADLLIAHQAAAVNIETTLLDSFSVLSTARTLAQQRAAGVSPLSLTVLENTITSAMASPATSSLVQFMTGAMTRVRVLASLSTGGSSSAAILASITSLMPGSQPAFTSYTASTTSPALVAFSYAVAALPASLTTTAIQGVPSATGGSNLNIMIVAPTPRPTISPTSSATPSASITPGYVPPPVPGLSGGAIAGIVVGSIAGGIIILALVFNFNNSRMRAEGKVISAAAGGVGGGGLNVRVPPGGSSPSVASQYRTLSQRSKYDSSSASAVGGGSVHGAVEGSYEMANIHTQGVLYEDENGGLYLMPHPAPDGGIEGEQTLPGGVVNPSSPHLPALPRLASVTPPQAALNASAILRGQGTQYISESPYVGSYYVTPMLERRNSLGPGAWSAAPHERGGNSSRRGSNAAPTSGMTPLGGYTPGGMMSLAPSTPSYMPYAASVGGSRSEVPPPPPPPPTSSILASVAGLDASIKSSVAAISPQRTDGSDDGVGGFHGQLGETDDAPYTIQVSLDDAPPAPPHRRMGGGGVSRGRGLVAVAAPADVPPVLDTSATSSSTTRGAPSPLQMFGPLPTVSSE